MALNFPNTPTNGQTYTYNNTLYYYDSANVAWLTTYVAPPAAGPSISNENTSSSTYYPVVTAISSGTMTSVSVDTIDLTYVPSSGTLSAKVFNSLSDIKLKTDIEGFDGVMLLEDINPVSFKWKNNSMTSYGVIAQELEKAFPDLVQTNEQGIKSVSYMPLIGILLDVVKKQQKDIEEIKRLLNRKK